MTETVELPQYIDSTMMSCFKQCPQKFYKEFGLGRRPAALSVDLHAGGCFATAIETFYRQTYEANAPLELAMSRAIGAFLQEWGDFEPIKDTPKTKERVMEAFEAYVEMWPPMTDHVQPFRNADGSPCIEHTFAIPLEPSWPKPHPDKLFPTHPSGDPFIYAGRFDLLGEWRGRPVVRDEKTTKSIGDRWAEQWDLRAQFMGYVWACQQFGINLDTVIVRGIGILKTKFTLVEATKIYPRWMIERWLEQLRRDLWRLRRAWDEGYWDWNLGDACTAYGGCPFQVACTSPNPERWHEQFVVRRWNPLQKNPIAEQKAQQEAA